jgi:hypothetical protein
LAKFSKFATVKSSDEALCKKVRKLRELEKVKKLKLERPRVVGSKPKKFHSARWIVVNFFATHMNTLLAV